MEIAITPGIQKIRTPISVVIQRITIVLAVKWSADTLRCIERSRNGIGVHHMPDTINRNIDIRCAVAVDISQYCVVVILYYWSALLAAEPSRTILPAERGGR